MDETTSRRGFLKGLGAAVALLSVAPALIVSEARAIAPIEPEALAPLRAAGEFWMRVAGKWRLVGGISTFATRHEVAEIPSWTSPYQGLMRRENKDFDVELVTDVAAAEMLSDAFYDGDRVDMAMAFRDREFEMPGAFLLAHELCIQHSFIEASLSGSYDQVIHRCR